MLMKPMYFGETATITLPSGEEIIILLSKHRSSLGEPIIGFKTPEGSYVRRLRMQHYLDEYLQEVHIFRIHCAGQNEALIVAAHEPQALRRYRKRYPDAEQLEIELVEDSLNQPLRSYPWYEQLQRLYDHQARAPFFIEPPR